MFKQHLEMIGRNETASKKAKFWQSYIRSLKGKILIIKQIVQKRHIDI